MRKSLVVSVALAIALALIISGASLGSSLVRVLRPVASGPYKVGFILDGPLNDEGFDTAINLGMQQVTHSFGSKVQVNYKLNVPESPQSTQVIDSLVQSGDQMIFATSFGYHTYMAAAAKEYPNVKFIQYESTELAKNLSESYIGIDQAWYLAGMAAGALTKTNKLGFVASFPIPALLIQVNGFELGARAVNPKATTRVLWMNSWYNPSNETQAAHSLASSGCDVLADGNDDPAVVEAGESLGLPVVGHDQAGIGIRNERSICLPRCRIHPSVRMQPESPDHNLWNWDGLLVPGQYGESGAGDHQLQLFGRQNDQEAG